MAILAWLYSQNLFSGDMLIIISIDGYLDYINMNEVFPTDELD